MRAYIVCTTLDKSSKTSWSLRQCELIAATLFVHIHIYISIFAICNFQFRHSIFKHDTARFCMDLLLSIKIPFGRK